MVLPPLLGDTCCLNICSLFLFFPFFVGNEPFSRAPVLAYGPFKNLSERRPAKGGRTGKPPPGHATSPSRTLAFLFFFEATPSHLRQCIPSSVSSGSLSPGPPSALIGLCNGRVFFVSSAMVTNTQHDQISFLFFVLLLGGRVCLAFFQGYFDWLLHSYRDPASGRSERSVAPRKTLLFQLSLLGFGLRSPPPKLRLFLRTAPLCPLLDSSRKRDFLPDDNHFPPTGADLRRAIIPPPAKGFPFRSAFPFGATLP